MPKKFDEAAEVSRLKKMMVYEGRFEPCALICGVDEAGRGPLAGPVAAGAVILPKDALIYYLNDSKKLSEKRREALYDEISARAVAWNVCFADNGVIDDINILQAVYRCMKDAINGLSIRPQHLLVDALSIPGLDIPQTSIVRGDAASVSIAAASIMAKVKRDRLMMEYDAVYPEYGFARHKGYGTKEHIAAIRKYGPCPIHRMTFIRKFI